MSRVSTKELNRTGSKSLPESKIDFLEVDPEAFRSSVERHQDRILRPIIKPLSSSESKVFSESKKPTLKNERPKRQRRHKTDSSFIKLEAGSLPIEEGRSASSKKLLALRLPNGIELEFWS